MAELFKSFGFHSEIEHEMYYIYQYRAKKHGGKKELKVGFLDVYAKKNDTEIAVEFDSPRVMREKNLGKLFRCEFLFCYLHHI